MLVNIYLRGGNLVVSCVCVLSESWSANQVRLNYSRGCWPNKHHVSHPNIIYIYIDILDMLLGLLLLLLPLATHNIVTCRQMLLPLLTPSSLTCFILIYNHKYLQHISFLFRLTLISFVSLYVFILISSLK